MHARRRTVRQPIARGQQPASADVRGFSLLELIAVMIILALTLAVTAPSLRGFAASQETQETARNMLTLIQWARMQAAADARPYRLNINPNLPYNGYWVEVQEAGEFKPVASDFGRRFSFPQGMVLEWRVPAGGQNTQGYITVNPNGTYEPATLRLIGRANAAFELTCLTPAEPFRIVAVEEVLP